jgi:hypothetical protein
MSKLSEIISYAVFLLVLITAIAVYSYRLGQLRERHKDG